MSARLQHDVAFATATSLLEVVALALPAEVQRDVFIEYYDVIKAALEAYRVQETREFHRLNPSQN